MKTAMFVNSTEEACGVFQFGKNLGAILTPSERIKWWYAECDSFESFMASFYHCWPDYIVFNWSSLMGGYMAGAPFSIPAKQLICYHDGDIDESRWAGILFADPTMPQHGKWHPIGRPIPTGLHTIVLSHKVPLVGVHGFIGAWADRVVDQVIREFEYATIRLLLPSSHYCDSQGNTASAMASKCRDMVRGTGVHIEVTHAFLTPNQLLEWLSQNTLNCYIRDGNWRGVSSAPDYALAARRPIAVNKCNAFRHLHSTTPSICVEDSSLSDIIANGLSPLVPLYVKWSAENVRKGVEDVLLGLQ